MANIITELHLEMSANWYVTKKLNSIGRVGENTVTKLIIEPTEILDNVTYEIEIADASGSKNVAELTVDGTELYLILTANMLTTSGITKMQVRGLFADGSIKKSNIFELKVNRSISATDYYEEYSVTIFDQLVNECRDIIEGAESYAVRAETAAVNAEAYSESASASAEAASASEATASTASTAAVNAAASAESASTSAHTSAETATTAASSASASASTAQTSAQTAQSASVTAQSASEAAQTASTAATSAATSAENSASTATTAASNASASATAAASSASNASNSATSASTSASNAAASETNAAASATSASTAASNANTSATNAANSAVAAATSATNAHNSEVNASTSETNASTSAAEAEASAESIAASVLQINENTYRINDLEAIIAGYQEADLPTGAIATVTDGTALLMPSLKIGIEPVQDLHGYDHPWVGGAGKNKIPPRNDGTISTVGLTIAIKDGVITLNGTASESGGLRCSETNFQLPAGTYTASYGTNTAYLHLRNITDGVDINTFTFTLDSTKTLQMYFDYVTGNTYNNIAIKPQIEEGTTATSYEPYSNICPISGWTEANVTRTGKNLYKAELNNYYLDTVTGLPVAEAGYEVSGFIPISANQSIYIPQSDSARRWFYDKFKNPKIYLQNANNQIYTAQEDGYIRITLNKKATLYSTYQIEYGSTATTYELYNGTTYTIEFKDGDNPLTVYGGTLDVTTGELVVDRKLVNMGNLSWAYDTSYDRFASNNIPDSEPPSGARITSFISSIYEVIDDGRPISQVTSGQMYSSFDSTQTSAIVMVHDNRFTDATEFKTAVTGQTFVYKLATPTTYHLTPAQIRTLVGNNNIWADTGDVLSGKYFKEL